MRGLIFLALMASVVVLATCGDQGKGGAPSQERPPATIPDQPAVSAKLVDILANPVQFQGKKVKTEATVVAIEGRGPGSKVQISADGKTATLEITSGEVLTKLEEAVGKTAQLEIAVGGGASPSSLGLVFDVTGQK